MESENKILKPVKYVAICTKVENVDTLFALYGLVPENFRMQSFSDARALCEVMSKKVINKATTREQKLYQRDKSRIAEYYTQNIKEDAKVIDIHLNFHGYTNLKK